MRGQTEAKYEGLRIKSIPATDRLLDVCRRHIGNKSFHVIGPDEGSRFLSQHIGEGRMRKKRGDYRSIGSIRHREITKLKADPLSLSHQTVVLVDDIVSTGTTMLGAVRQLRDNGIPDIYCSITHGLFLNNCLPSSRN
jgi:ribose-phosphate pyrophosphokinase